MLIPPNIYNPDDEEVIAADALLAGNDTLCSRIKVKTPRFKWKWIDIRSVRLYTEECTKTYCGCFSSCPHHGIRIQYHDRVCRGFCRLRENNGGMIRTCKDSYILSKIEKLLDVSEIKLAWITCRFFSTPPYNKTRFCPFTSGKRAMLLYVLGEQWKHENVGWYNF